MTWQKLSHSQIKSRIFSALAKNKNYHSDVPLLGIPGTYLDTEQFYNDAPFLKDSPFLSVLINNPNHIGCHTLVDDESEDIFMGTQSIERELINLCAEQIFKCEKNQQDGYVSPGGTEANIEAMWIYRNYFITEHNAKIDEIALVYSEDSHYSMPKGANLLNLKSIVLQVDENTREILQYDLKTKISKAQQEGIKYFIVIVNMSTTMFGSVDDVDMLGDFFRINNLIFKIHIDGAYGGFIYPFTNVNSVHNFANPYVNSITIDGHKMLQTPYGTGIFLIRKGYMDYACTKEAQYIPIKDYTICGSRSGANAVSIWMILMTHGYEGWKYKMQLLTDKALRICEKLDELKVNYFHHANINIIAIKSDSISKELAHKYYLVADSYEHEAKWFKIVVMPHVKQGHLDSFLNELEADKKRKIIS